MKYGAGERIVCFCVSECEKRGASGDENKEFSNGVDPFIWLGKGGSFLAHVHPACRRAARAPK